MPKENRNVSIESARSALRSTGARALATALITSIDQAEQEGRKLSQMQQIDLATMHIMTYIDILDGAELFEADEIITRHLTACRSTHPEWDTVKCNLPKGHIGKHELVGRSYKGMTLSWQ